jgi:hypothetical protein
MAHFKTLPDQALDAIAAQLGQLYKVPDSLGAGPSDVTLHETVEVWLLQADETLKPTNDLRLMARRSGYWHHQVKDKGKAVGYATSAPIGPDSKDWSVRQFFMSDIAEKIDDTIAWLDGNLRGQPEVRLLQVPAYHIIAAWAVEGDEQSVVIVVSPDGSALKSKHLYSTKEFLDAIRSMWVIRGIV